MPSDAELLAIQFRTAFVVGQSGRISARNDPDHSLAPRFALSGCASGNVYGVRSDAADSDAACLMRLAASEPPFVDRSDTSRRWHRYMEVLDRNGLGLKPNLGLTYVLPNDVAYQHDVQLIGSDSPEGRALSATLAANGIPPGLAAMGFVDVSDFWDPWCVAMQNGEVVSVAFAARLSQAGADLGLATSPGLRGNGYAAAATAGWARLPTLRSRTLFYSTNQTNIASQRVAAKLGLRFLGGRGSNLLEPLGPLAESVI
jgi:hypothetical protein